jgi:hypothetical protein
VTKIDRSAKVDGRQVLDIFGFEKYRPLMEKQDERATLARGRNEKNSFVKVKLQEITSLRKRHICSLFFYTPPSQEHGVAGWSNHAKNYKKTEDE